MNEAVFVIILLVWGGVAIARKLLPWLQEQAAAQAGGREVFEATPEQVADFLRSIEQRRTQVQVDAEQATPLLEADGGGGAPAARRGGLLAVPERPGPRVAAGPAVPAVPARAVRVAGRPMREDAERAARSAAARTARAEAAAKRRRSLGTGSRKGTKRASQGAKGIQEGAKGAKTARVRQVLRTAQGPAALGAKPGPAGVRTTADLRQAVIWSEILGPPVSVRRRRGPG